MEQGMWFRCREIRVNGNCLWTIGGYLWSPKALGSLNPSSNSSTELPKLYLMFDCGGLYTCFHQLLGKALRGALSMLGSCLQA